MRAGRWAAVCAVVVAWGGTGCIIGPTAPAAPTEAEAVVSRTGGRVVLGEQATLTIANGALDRDVTVSARFVPAPVSPGGTARSEVLELTPHGTSFRIPARVTLRYAAGNGAPLQVLRLADADDRTWEPVGGVHFENGLATFDITHFSFYVVTESGQCELVDTTRACDGTCECCGGATCVDTRTDTQNCGACGVSCDAMSFCSSGSTCTRVGPDALCANRQLYVVQGELPFLDVVSPEQTTDGLYAAQLASAVASTCAGLSVATVSQASDGLLDPCTDAPLVGGGTTLLVTGGGFTQRLASYLERDGALVTMEVSADELEYTFRSQAGTELVRFPRAALSDEHDYFVISFERDPAHGAQVLQVYGVGWSGTPVATWYFINRVLPARAAGTLGWSHGVLVEWHDDGDHQPSDGDTFTVLAADVP